MIQLLTRHTILEARSYLSLGERPEGNEHSSHTHLSCSNPQHHYSRDKHPHHSSSQRWWIMQISHYHTSYPWEKEAAVQPKPSIPSRAQHTFFLIFSSCSVHTLTDRTQQNRESRCRTQGIQTKMQHFLSQDDGKIHHLLYSELPKPELPISNKAALCSQLPGDVLSHR